MKIDVISVSKKFKDVYVLKNINMHFESGKIYALTGRNGSGKSVLLKVICGLYAPSEGKIILNDALLTSTNIFTKNIRALIEKPAFFSHLTGFENLKLLAQIQKKIEDKEILETLKIANLYEEKDKKYHEYSLGMKQKLGIAQVFMENPDILIFDEPFNGVEQETVIKIKTHLINLANCGKLIIISSHIESDLSDMVDKTYRFDAGKLID